MHVIIAAAAFIAWLYFWLLGHWFARILAVPLGGGLGALMASADGARPRQSPIGILIGVGLSWPAASAPTYYWRHRLRRASLELSLRQ